MTEIFTEFDPAEYLTTPEAIAEFMSDALETGDASYIAKAMGVVARAKGMSELASEHGNPTLKTLLAVMKALGVDMAARPHIAH
ncbi:addiction module antidote protein [Pseudomonas fluorescens]|uniref:Addiction module antidote protein n=1 Tax=Pseudomonas fluorescens TaxID=294 RepID=A0A5E7QEF9_PSEFL|nr:addiction module antidote protein [Pseudomonas fluorescens]VVP60672.1 hypothetical protein PS880_06186 [Pseudomonas fluorescens]